MIILYKTSLEDYVDTNYLHDNDLATTPNFDSSN